jgi:hypothetical protein
VGGKPGTLPSQYTPDVNDVIRLTPDRSRRLVLYCNGLHCGRSKRFAVELLKAGYTNVKRYQLGIPAWRALGGVTQVEKDALLSLRARDQSAVLVDAREPRADRKRIRDSVSISIGDASKAKDDGRLPMTDHNTRIFVVGVSIAVERRTTTAPPRKPARLGARSARADPDVAFFEGDVAGLGL